MTSHPEHQQRIQRFLGPDETLLETTDQDDGACRLYLLTDPHGDSSLLEVFGVTKPHHIALPNREIHVLEGTGILRLIVPSAIDLSPEPKQPSRFGELLDKSPLGTPESRALQELTPESLIKRLGMALAREPTEEVLVEPGYTHVLSERETVYWCENTGDAPLWVRERTIEWPKKP